eukprot:1542405-Prymnesium_polylepis.1
MTRECAGTHRRVRQLEGTAQLLEVDQRRARGAHELAHSRRDLGDGADVQVGEEAAEDVLRRAGWRRREQVGRRAPLSLDHLVHLGDERIERALVRLLLGAAARPAAQRVLARLHRAHHGQLRGGCLGEGARLSGGGTRTQ